MARTIAMALSMPLNERRLRYEAMMAKLHRHSIQQWFADFVESLQDTEIDEPEIEPLPAAAAGLLAHSSAPAGTRYH
jgi:trehalose 6-phosphate synthase